MQTVFSAILEALRRGERAVLCNIIASSGSTPRGAGAKMAVFQDGSTVGTVGGGAVELRAVQQAETALLGGTSVVREYRLAPNDVQDIGMICGGDVTLCFLVVGPADLALVERVCALLPEERPAWLVTGVTSDGAWHMGIWEEDRLWGMDVPAEEVRPLLGSRGLLRRGEPMLYAEPLTRRGTVYLFGAGHVGLELAPVLNRVGFRVAVYDNRPHALTREKFPTAAKLILGDFDRINLTLRPEDYVVIMTSGHQGDFEILRQVLPTPVTYIGCIGSRRKVAATRERLRESGFTDRDIDRIHSPIGLPIGGETPAEIAVSIAAELIAHRTKLEKAGRNE